MWNLQKRREVSRKCIVTKKGPMSGNNVSHANNRTRRRFLPNLQNVSFVSETLKKTVRLRISTRAIKTIEATGGFDEYIKKNPSFKI